MSPAQERRLRVGAALILLFVPIHPKKPRYDCSCRPIAKSKREQPCQRGRVLGSCDDLVAVGSGDADFGDAPAGGRGLSPTAQARASTSSFVAVVAVSRASPSGQVEGPRR